MQTQCFCMCDTGAAAGCDVVRACLRRVLAYGQTGAGKSWTMSGNEQHPGIIPRMSSELFKKIDALRAAYESRGKERHFMVEASFFEIYNEQVFDLLVPKVGKGKKRPNLMLRETKKKGVYVDGLNELVVKSEKEIADLIRRGNENRSVGSTSMNAESSRSHSIFTIKINQREAVEAAGGKEMYVCEAGVTQGSVLFESKPSRK